MAGSATPRTRNLRTSSTISEIRACPSWEQFPFRLSPRFRSTQDTNNDEINIGEHRASLWLKLAQISSYEAALELLEQHAGQGRLTASGLEKVRDIIANKGLPTNTSTTALDMARGYDGDGDGDDQSAGSPEVEQVHSGDGNRPQYPQTPNSNPRSRKRSRPVSQHQDSGMSAGSLSSKYYDDSTATVSGGLVQLETVLGIAERLNTAIVNTNIRISKLKQDKEEAEKYQEERTANRKRITSAMTMLEGATGSSLAASKTALENSLAEIDAESSGKDTTSMSCEIEKLEHTMHGARADLDTLLGSVSHDTRLESCVARLAEFRATLAGRQI